MRSITFLSTALNCHTFTDRDILYVASNFCSSLLIDEDELVVPRVSIVIFHPAVTRVVRVFVSLHTSISDTKMRRGRDMDEVGCDVGTLVVPLNRIDEGGDLSKMDDGVVVVDGDRREVVGCGMGESSDSRH
jgi:hypothetical protein